MQWTVRGDKPLYRDEWLDIRMADVQLPDGRRIEHRLIRTPPGAGCVVVRDEQVTGWRPGPLTPLLAVEPTAGLSDSVHHVYLADGAELIGPTEDG